MAFSNKFNTSISTPTIMPPHYSRIHEYKESPFFKNGLGVDGGLSMREKYEKLEQEQQKYKESPFFKNGLGVAGGLSMREKNGMSTKPVEQEHDMNTFPEPSKLYHELVSKNGVQKKEKIINELLFQTHQLQDQLKKQFQLLEEQPEQIRVQLKKQLEQLQHDINSKQKFIFVINSYISKLKNYEVFFDFDTACKDRKSFEIFELIYKLDEETKFISQLQIELDKLTQQVQQPIKPVQQTEESEPPKKKQRIETLYDELASIRSQIDTLNKAVDNIYQKMRDIN